MDHHDRWTNFRISLRAKTAAYSDSCQGNSASQEVDGPVCGKGVLPELRVPTNCAWRDIHSFLGSKFDWIVAAESELASRTTAPRNIYTPAERLVILAAEFRWCWPRVASMSWKRTILVSMFHAPILPGPKQSRNKLFTGTEGRRRLCFLKEFRWSAVCFQSGVIHLG